MKKNSKIKLQWFVNTIVKLFLFPLFIVGILLRVYDSIFKKIKKWKKECHIIYGIKICMGGGMVDA